MIAGRTQGERFRIGGLIALAMGLVASPAIAQESVRPAPLSSEDFETDADGDGVPDGWYNLRDAKLVDGGNVGPKSLRFENDKPGRQARASRAFAVDGRETEALVVGLWVKVTNPRAGERLGEEAGLLIDFLGEGLVATARGGLGPWRASLGEGWVRVAKRIAVPRGTRDAILTTGLLGGIGTLQIDGLTVEPIPVGGVSTTNLILNGDLERGDPEPPHWYLDDGAERSFPGHKSATCLRLHGSGGQASIGLAVLATGLREVEFRLMARGTGLRIGDGARAVAFFADDMGSLVPWDRDGTLLLRWSGSFDWREDRVKVAVPAGTARVVFKVETASRGTLEIDDLTATASPDAENSRWTPGQASVDTDGWKPYEPAPGIAAGSALDASGLVPAPAGSRGAIVIRDDHLAWERGGRARFFGAVLLPTLGFAAPERADALADRLAKSGVNLVRLSGLDAPLGPARSLFDDGRDDTRELDPDALERFDHLIAACKAKGIYVALELLASRRFREGDEVPGWIGLPPGGGAAAAFDPTIRALTLKAAKDLLGHVNPETKLALRDDPVLAWVTLAGERTLLDRDDPDSPLPEESRAVLRSEENRGGHRRSATDVEADQWRSLADDLRKWGLKRPIAGSSHWRREPEFVAAQGRSGLDLIDDRLYWAPQVVVDPDRRSMLWKLHDDLAADSARKRKGDRPYVVGEWCSHTDGAWALPFDGADLMLMARTAAVEDWDALCRRGVFLNPESWGSAPPGTSGGQDLFAAPEVLNANPQVFAMLPHAASLFLRTPEEGGRSRKAGSTSWDPKTGRLLIDTPWTQGLAGWPGRKPYRFETLEIEADSPFAVVMASSLGPEPIATSQRLLVSVVGRVEPTGLRYEDSWRREVADRGGPPLRIEPIKARITWKAQGAVKAFALNPDGSRKATVAVKVAGEGVTLEIPGDGATLHWELVQ